MHLFGDLGCGLMRHDVADLMRQHTGDLVLAVCARNQLSREVNTATCQAEAVNFGRIDEDKPKTNLGWWKCCEQPRANPFEVRVLGGVLDDCVLVLNHFGHRVAEPTLLPVPE